MQTRPARPTRPHPRQPWGPTPSRHDDHEPVAPRSLGLTGGIGSGKSAALEEFRRLGAAVLSSDEVVHAIYADTVVIDAVCRRFGPAALTADGHVDRTALGALAFAEPDGMAFLEQLVHPRVGAAREAWQDAQRRRSPRPPLLVCEVPLLFEAGLVDAFDAVLVVTASQSIRRDRVTARGQDFSARSGRQMTEDDKIKRADRYLVNDGSMAQLEEWVAERFEEYRT